MLQVMSASVSPAGAAAEAVTATKDPEKAPDKPDSPSSSPLPEARPDINNIPRTLALPFVNLRPIPSMHHPRPWSSLTNFLLTFQQPTVAIAVLGYSFLWYWWVLSVITMVPSAYAEYSALIQGLLFLGLFVGTLVAEVGCSGWLSDWLVGWLARRRGGVRVAEMRLWLGYPAVLITGGESLLPERKPGYTACTDWCGVVGLILWGISIDKNYHWMVGQVAFFLCNYPFPRLPPSPKKCIYSNPYQSQQESKSGTP